MVQYRLCVECDGKDTFYATQLLSFKIVLANSHRDFLTQIDFNRKSEYREYLGQHVFNPCASGRQFQILGHGIR